MFRKGGFNLSVLAASLTHARVAQAESPRKTDRGLSGAHLDDVAQQPIEKARYGIGQARSAVGQAENGVEDAIDGAEAD